MGGAVELGRWGEEFAARFLEMKGFRVCGRNVRFGRGEIDLVARRSSLLAFVEVKTRAGRGFGAAVEAVDRRKLTRMRRIAVESGFLTGHRGEVRFDVIAIELHGGMRALKLEHLEGVSIA
jgi:putative endonuclease